MATAYICVFLPFIQGQLRDTLFWELGCIVYDARISSFSRNLAEGHKTGYKKAPRQKKTTKILRAHQYAKGVVLERVVVYTITYHLQQDITRHIAVVHIMRTPEKED